MSRSWQIALFVLLAIIATFVESWIWPIVEMIFKEG